MPPSEIKNVLARDKSFSRDYEQEHAEGGEFLPLTVWESRGWDVRAIEARSQPHDVRTNALGMTTYRAPIVSKVDRQRDRQSTILRVAQDAKKRFRKQATSAHGSLRPVP